jgi:hypothetical protein
MTATLSTQFLRDVEDLGYVIEPSPGNDQVFYLERPFERSPPFESPDQALQWLNDKGITLVAV